MEVYVIRHTPVSVGKDICYGQADVPLAENFETAFKAYQRRLDLPFDAVYSSPSTRCLLLANQFSDKPLITIELQEMNFGEWELQSWNSIDAEGLNRWMEDFINVNTPGGENLQLLYNRVCNFLDDLRLQPYKQVLLVTHAGVHRCIWSYLLGIALQEIFKIPIGYNEILHFSLAKNASLDQIKSKG